MQSANAYNGVMLLSNVLLNTELRSEFEVALFIEELNDVNAPVFTTLLNEKNELKFN